MINNAFQGPKRGELKGTFYCDCYYLPKNQQRGGVGGSWDSRNLGLPSHFPVPQIPTMVLNPKQKDLTWSSWEFFSLPDLNNLNQCFTELSTVHYVFHQGPSDAPPQ